MYKKNKRSQCAIVYRFSVGASKKLACYLFRATGTRSIRLSVYMDPLETPVLTDFVENDTSGFGSY